MRISILQVQQTARMAKLSLTENELTRMAKQLQYLLDYAEVLAGLGNAGVITGQDRTMEATALVPQDHTLNQVEVLALAQDSSQGMIRVPRVVEDV